MSEASCFDNWLGWEIRWIFTLRSVYLWWYKIINYSLTWSTIILMPWSINFKYSCFSPLLKNLMKSVHCANVCREPSCPSLCKTLSTCLLKLFLPVLIGLSSLFKAWTFLHFSHWFQLPLPHYGFSFQVYWWYFAFFCPVLFF